MCGMKDDFMEYMGYRNNILEEIIEEGVNASENGETTYSVDRGDLTDDEVEYIQEELERRIRSRH